VLAAVLALTADLALSLGAHEPRVPAGDDVAFTVVIANRGPAAARDVRLLLHVPHSITSWSAEGCEREQCMLGDMAPGEQRSVSIVAHPAEAKLQSIVLTANVRSATRDPNGRNDFLDIKTDFVRGVDLVSKLTTVSNIDPEGRTRVGLSILNRGNAPAHDAQITIRLPEDTNVTGELPEDCRATANVVTCGLAELAPEAETSIAFTADAPARYRGGTEGVVATAFAKEPDIRPSDNTARATWSFPQLFVVTSAADRGPGTLRQAIVDANQRCATECRIRFRIESPIVLGEPLPPVIVNVSIEGPATLDGGKLLAGDGLVLHAGSVSQLLIEDFPGRGIAAEGARGLRIAGNTIRGNLNGGIELSDCEVTIQQNVIASNGANGLRADAATRGAITDNQFVLNDDIAIDAASAALRITNNTLQDNGGVR
jgi:parallel beta-helix repeat protein